MSAWAPFAALALCAVSTAAAPAPSLRVDIEVFSVSLAADTDAGLLFARHEGPLVHGQDPDLRSRSLAAGDADAIAAIHSTSWRWEPEGRIVLTYVAWLKEGRLAPDARPLPSLSAPGPTDPLHPRPTRIRELDPLAHGLRHFAFLLQQDRDGALTQALGVRAVSALRSFEPAVAGELRAR